MEYVIEQVELPEQQAAVVMGRSPVEGIAEFLAGAFTEVMTVLPAQQLTPVGPPFALYDPADSPVFGVVGGFPCDGSVSPVGRVASYALPAGPALQTIHVGPYEDVAAAYHAIEAYLAEHGLTPAGPPWESYLDEPGVAEPRTIVTWPVRRA